MQALSMLIDSYRRFLSVHYGEFTNQKEKTKHFLEDIFRQRPIAAIRDMPGINETLEALELSGLRKDIYIYEHEMDNYPDYPVKRLMPVNFPDFSLASHHGKTKGPLALLTNSLSSSSSKKTALSFNKDGLFMFALATAKQNDDAFMNYIKLRYKSSEMHPFFSAESFLDKQQSNAPLWFEQLPIIIDIYYKMLLMDERTIDGGLMSTSNDSNFLGFDQLVTELAPEKSNR